MGLMGQNQNSCKSHESYRSCYAIGDLMGFRDFFCKLKQGLAKTRRVFGDLPRRKDNGHDASPAALRQLLDSLGGNVSEQRRVEMSARYPKKR